MQTLDEIVEDNLLARFDTRNEVMEMEGFDYQSSLEIDINIDGGKYNLLEATKIMMITDELVENATKAIYGFEIPHKRQDNEGLKKICGRIKFNVYEKGENYVLSCEDNGCGIPEENKDLIFIYEFSTRGTGGVGLFTIREHVEYLGGEIYFKSKVGEGTTFYVELPKLKSKI